VHLSTPFQYSSEYGYYWKHISNLWKDKQLDRFDAMAVLLAVVEAGNLSAAGRKLGVPLSTVSRKVSDLEAYLGAQLLIRSNRKIVLTDAGAAYVMASKQILDAVAAAELAASGEYSAAKGELVVTAPVVFGRLHVLPAVTEFLHAYPDIDIRLMLADRNLHLTDDHVDVALRIGALPDSSLRATKLGAVRRVVCGSPDYFAQHGGPDHPDDLARHSCITFTALGLPDSWTFGVAPYARTVAIRSRLAVNTAEAAIDAATAGLGVTRVLSYQVAEQLRIGRLVLALNDHAPDPIPVSLVYGGQEILPLKLRAFLDFAIPRLRHGLGALP
jgi:DNA-binding transcriptional LysR family regulator